MHYTDYNFVSKTSKSNKINVDLSIVLNDSSHKLKLFSRSQVKITLHNIHSHCYPTQIAMSVLFNWIFFSGHFQRIEIMLLLLHMCLKIAKTIWVICIWFWFWDPYYSKYTKRISTHEYKPHTNIVVFYAYPCQCFIRI